MDIVSGSRLTQPDEALRWPGQTEGIRMKSYILTTGTVFGLLTLAHIARVFVDGAQVLTEPVFLLTTVASAALCVWAIVLLKQSSRPHPESGVA